MSELSNTKEFSAKSVSKETLPIQSVLGLIGTFYTFYSICYVVTSLYAKTKESLVIASAIEGALLFASMLIAILLVGMKNYKKACEDDAYNNSLKCLECIKSKMEDGFHNHGLLHLNELLEYERTLASDPNPGSCDVLIYTSDLATEKNAEKDVKMNIESGVRYIVLYFSNNCKDEEYERVKNLYSEKNLVDLSRINEYKDSFDGGLAKTLGFDVMIYKKSNGEICGYFSVDFVPEDRPDRICHDPKCPDMCNYGKENQTPFYKEFSFEIAKELYVEGLRIQKQQNGEMK